MTPKSILLVFFSILALSFSQQSMGQISAPGSVSETQTNYVSFPENDEIFIFCASQDNIEDATLQVITTIEGLKTFNWEKYNPLSGNFESFSTFESAANESTLSGLSDGGYRLRITLRDTEEVHRAWVFNSFITTSDSITNSNCDSFTLSGSYEAAPFIYYDPGTNDELTINREITVERLQGEAVISNSLEHIVFNPPPIDTEYTLRVYDQFGCESTTPVLYESIVPLAAFTADPMEGEAPLTVTFTNESQNGDPAFYEWFIYRDLDEIKRESERSQAPVDSVDYILNDQHPVIIFENSGTFIVKMVAKKTNQNQTCVDTVFLNGFIEVDTSFVAVPNVFTPNGDGYNDSFIVKFWSMQNMKISIFNRWGKRIHFWESDNIRGFEETYTATVWDGRVNNRFASPGVYYYIIEGRGRDDEQRKAHGFFHLFRGKD